MTCMLRGTQIWLDSFGISNFFTKISTVVEIQAFCKFVEWNKVSSRSPLAAAWMAGPTPPSQNERCEKSARSSHRALISFVSCCRSTRPLMTSSQCSRIARWWRVLSASATFCLGTASTATSCRRRRGWTLGRWACRTWAINWRRSSYMLRTGFIRFYVEKWTAYKRHLFYISMTTLYVSN